MTCHSNVCVRGVLSLPAFCSPPYIFTLCYIMSGVFSLLFKSSAGRGEAVTVPGQMSPPYRV